MKQYYHIIFRQEIEGSSHINFRPKIKDSSLYTTTIWMSMLQYYQTIIRHEIKDSSHTIFWPEIEDPSPIEDSGLSWIRNM